jgi:hypothetical protein
MLSNAFYFEEFLKNAIEHELRSILARLCKKLMMDWDILVKYSASVVLNKSTVARLCHLFLIVVNFFEKAKTSQMLVDIISRLARNLLSAMAVELSKFKTFTNIVLIPCSLN